MAATSRASGDPDADCHACRRSAKLGGAASISSDVRSPRASAALRFGGGHHHALAAALDRAQQPRALAGLQVLEALEDERPVLERGDQRRLGHRVGAVDLADVGHHERAPVGARDERLGVRPGEHHGQRARMRERRGERGDGLLAARVVVGMRDHPELAAGGRVVHADAEQVRREPVRELDRALGERRLRVALQPDRAEGRSGAVRSKAIITSAAETPSPASRCPTRRGLASLRVTSSCRYA